VWASGRARSQCGQASPEWLGLLLVIALLLAGTLAALGPLPLGVSFARTLGAKMICAVRLSDTCLRDELVEAYGTELAAAVREHAPEVFYERGMRALPVDFRRCRSASCADGAPDGKVWRSASDEPATAFLHVVDCRPGASHPSGGAASDCSGSRAGNLYLQYWFYYPDSATLRGVPVVRRKGYHADDWESYGVRVGPDGEVHVRASSHRGYNYSQGAANWGSEAGIGPLKTGAEALGARRRNGWGPETGALFVSGGSHAGNADAMLFGYSRLTPARRLVLIPLESIAAREQSGFAVTPPWRKQVWRDPEAEGTS
jgi:hypothetical protein